MKESAVVYVINHWKAPQESAGRAGLGSHTVRKLGHGLQNDGALPLVQARLAAAADCCHRKRMPALLQLVSMP